MEQSIPHELCQVLRQARRITVLTGAGISAESGIPTFRDA
ncbi:MAG: NAD-dependent deacylase, partial [Thermogemmatispora sp.]|nr:NAD-dependent deacylase [Thermogemmatispora sp.]